MSDMAIDLQPRRFTVDEYHRMAEIGIFASDERVELIDGLVVEMSPIGSKHWRLHARLAEYLVKTLGDDAFIVPQGSFPLGTHSEPQPDIAVLPRSETSGEGRVDPADILAVVEIAVSSLRTDTGPKLRVYARARIADYLVVDVEADALLHYQDPNDIGYATLRRLERGAALRLSRLPQHELAVEAFLPPTSP